MASFAAIHPSSAHFTRTGYFATPSRAIASPSRSSSVSMMTEALRGRTLDDALGTVEHFRLVMHGDETADEDRLGDAIALEGVAKYPVRVKCALLGWMAAKDAIQTYQGNGGNGDGREEA